jgi:hypothetical protein
MGDGAGLENRVSCSNTALGVRLYPISAKICVDNCSKLLYIRVNGLVASGNLVHLMVLETMLLRVRVSPGLPWIEAKYWFKLARTVNP